MMAAIGTAMLARAFPFLSRLRLLALRFGEAAGMQMWGDRIALWVTSGMGGTPLPIHDL